MIQDPVFTKGRNFDFATLRKSHIKGKGDCLAMIEKKI